MSPKGPRRLAPIKRRNVSKTRRKKKKKRRGSSCVGRKPASVCTKTRSCKMTTRRNKGRGGKGRAGHCRKKKNKKARKSKKSRK